MLRLIEALRVIQPTSIAFVGAGGKTTALFLAAKNLLNSTAGQMVTSTVLVTTSTHLGAWQAEQADHFFSATTIEDIDRIKKDLPGGVILITGEKEDELLQGLSPKLLDQVQRLADERNLPLLMEADGAHGCPLKAPAEHEPAIPEFSQHVVVVAGLLGLGKPLTKEWVHRPEHFAELSGLRIGAEITWEALAKVLMSVQGGLKNIPKAARRSVLLNQADTPELQSQGKAISDCIITSYDASIIASLSIMDGEMIGAEGQKTYRQNEIHSVVESIGGVILAAGGSSRFGVPKQLLPWKGEPFIRHVALAALRAGLDPVVVVVGSSAEEIQAAVNDLSVRIVDNTEWKNGLSSSIKAGIGSLPINIGGAIFLQGDQPQIPHTLIRTLVEAHQSDLHSIIAPQIDGQRGNPVLFDSRTFPDLLSLVGDVGGRVLFSNYSVQWIQWHDPNLLIDIDTPEDYDKFLKIYSQEGVGS